MAKLLIQLIMKKLLFLLLLISGMASAQFSPTSSKTRFINGIGLGSKLDAAFGTADSLVLYTKLDSTLMFKYKGMARALAYASQLASYKLASDTGFVGGYTTRERNKQGNDSVAALLSNYKPLADSSFNSGYTTRITTKNKIDSLAAMKLNLTGGNVTGVVNSTTRLNLGGATDDASEALNVTGKGLFSDRLQASYFKTNSAVLSVAANAATTIFSAAANGRYEVYAFINGGNATNYAAIATVITEGGTSRIVANNATYLQLTVSGTNVQVTHQSSNPSDVGYSWLLITN